MEKKVTAAITAIGGYVPPDLLTNADLEKLVETNDEWIRARTGITERRILKGEGLGTSDLLVPAVQDILKKRNIAGSEIDCLIVGTVTPDMQFPATANVITDKAGLTSAWGFDLSAACSGFLYALTVGASLIESGRYKKVIVAGADKMSSIIDYKDRNTCIIFGDGGGAVLLEPNTSGYGVLDSALFSDGVGRKHLRMDGGGSVLPASHETVDKRQHYVYQEGAAVFKYAIKGMGDAVKTLMDRNQLTTDDIRWLVPHQANIRIIESTAERANIPMDRVMLNIGKFGNTTAGTLPLCLWDYEGQLKKGDLIILAAFGGGFTWGATLIRWGY